MCILATIINLKIKNMVCKATLYDKLVFNKWCKYSLAFLALILMGNEKAGAYCTTGLFGTPGTPWINSVSITGTTLSNLNTGFPTGGYIAYPATGNTTATLLLGSSYTINVDFAGTAAIASLWIDWNQNNTFDASEWYQLTTNSATASFSFTVPLTATPGTTGMRIRSRLSGNTNGSGDACSNFGSGEVEDYTLTIAAPVPCAGTPVAGTAMATPDTVCLGASSVLYLSGQSIASNLSYQWQRFNTVTSAWDSVGNAPTYTATNISAATQFRARLKCGNLTPGVSDSAFSTVVTVNVRTGGIPYLETFESITAANQLPRCMTATSIAPYVYTYTAATGSYNQTNHTTPTGSKFASFRYGSSDWLFTPKLSLTGGQSYLFTFWYVTDGLGGWQDIHGGYGTSPTAGAMTTIGTPVLTPINSTYSQYQAVVSPATSGDYYFGVYVLGNTSPWYVTVDDIGVQLLSPCAARPTAGTITPASPINGCAGTVYSLATTGTSVAGGLSYQWQDSSAATGGWNNVVGGSGGTTPFYTTQPLYDSTRYRLIVTCNNTNQKDTTAVLRINIVPPVYAPVPYTEDFESWVNRCSTTDVPSQSWANQPSTGNASWRRHDQGSSASWTAATSYLYSPAFMHGSYSARFHSGYTSPAGTKGIMDLFVNCSTTTGNKELTFNYINIDGTDSLVVQMSTDGGATFTRLGGYATAAAWTPVTLPVASNTARTVIRFIGVSDYGSTDVGLDYVQVLPPCTNKPTAGAINPVTPCKNTNFQLSTTGTTSAAGLIYQWQDSVNGNWVNSSTQLVYTTSISGPTTFRLIVTCTNSNDADTTRSYTVVPAAFYLCYCAPTYATGATANTITKVSVLNMTNTSTGASPWYSNFVPQQPTPLPIASLTMGQTDTVKVTMSSNATNYSALWIDFNHDSQFDTSEYFSLNTNAGANGVSNILVTPPLNALPGITRMRIRGADRSPVLSTMPCGPTGSAYGEAEDYLVNVLYPPCNGPLNAGIALSSDSVTCNGYTFNLTDTTHEYKRSAISWSWESSHDGGLSWDPVPNSANKDTLNNVLFMGSVSYRLKMLCNVTGDSTYSIPVAIKQNAPYACYCYSQSNGGSGDSSDIGSVAIGLMTNLTGGPHLLNPEAIRRRTDYTYIPNIVMSARGTYRLAIYHTQRNGTHADARVSVFIDYNNDLVYDAYAQPNSERVFTGITTQGNYYIDTVIHVPDAVIPNVRTGLRVILNNDLNPLSPANLGCGPYGSGETEDYIVMFNRVPQSVGGVSNIEEVALYPNPTSGRFTVSIDATKPMDKLDVNVMTITGQTMMKKTYSGISNKFTEELDMSEAAKGIYFVEVKTSAGDKVVRKLVIR